ncbi:MAG: heavy metal translocating P-type ATPase [Actinobacteria bacterium]|nr:heavy metal translocating P-type ATPase [Actinomycetota bacterium]
MTEQTLELAMLLPREAECGKCVDEVGRELGRLDGVHAVEADVPRGLLNVRFDESTLGADEVRTFARRAGAQAHCADHCPLAVHDHGTLDLLQPLPGEDGAAHRVLHVTGMDCADCATKLQGALRKERGVRAADVNFGAATLTVAIDPAKTDLGGVFTAVRRLGYDTVERKTAAAAPGASPGATAARMAAALPLPWYRERRALLTLLSGALVVAGFVAEAVAPAASPWLFAAAMIAGGTYVARAAFFSLRARQVDMNVLMTLAALGAAAIGQWSEAGLVVFLFGLGTWLQVATLARTRRAITGLMALTPPEAVVLRSGAEVTVPADDLVAGDIILIRPGERVAVDGVVLEGNAAANQAPVTGESRPVAKAPGDQVFAGSIIEGGSLRLRATTAAADNTIAKIVHLVEEAQAQRAPAESIVDRFAARYTPIVVAMAAAVAFVPPLLGASFDTWFYRGLALLIISCPCALVISTPVSILAALANATRNGVLIKGGVYLEQMAKLGAVAFDKTGTLTTGRPQVTDVVGLRETSRSRVLEIAAALERLSEHPLARAIVERTASAYPEPAHDACECGEAGCEAAPAGAPGPSVERFRAIPGAGVRAEFEGRLYFVGRPELLGIHAGDATMQAAVTRLEREGKTAVAVGDEDGALGVIAVSDPLRAEVAAAITALHGLGVAHVAMLTGDNPDTAAVVGARAGIEDVRAGLLPAQKVAAVAELRDRYGAVAMVGDGVNDAPALAAATLGIAMGAAGTDVALETADIALMGDDLSAMPHTIRLARRTTRVIWQNIVFSIVV